MDFLIIEGDVLFENQKFCITQLKTVISREDKSNNKKIYSSPTTFFGMSASVYGKLVNCCFGGTFQQKAHAVTHVGTVACILEGCLYDKDCITYSVPGTMPVDTKSYDAVKLLNVGREKIRQFIPDVTLCEWTLEDNKLCFVKNSTQKYNKNGDGSKENPYIIKTADDFVKFTNDLNNLVTYKGKYFLQVADIDLSSRTDYKGADGSRKPYLFEGFYDGGGHTLNIALDITDKKCNNTVFPNTNGTIINLGVTGTVASDGEYVSGFTRSVRNNGIVANCYSLVKMTTNVLLESSYEIRYNISGQSKITFDDKSLDIKPSSVLYIPANLRTSSLTEQVITPSNSISIYFDTDFTLMQDMFVYDASTNKNIEVLFSKIYMIWLSRKSNYYLECMSLIYEIISKLSKPVGNYLSTDKYSVIENGVSYLYENCFNKIIDFYYPAQLCGISYTYFKQLFIQKFGKAPKQYIMMLRMERAVELLNVANCSVTETAERCGFDNVYYFSRAFKKYFGFSPTKFTR